MRALDRLPLHPFFFACYPVLVLLSMNEGEIAPVEALRPLILALMLAAALLLLARAAFRDTAKGAALASLAILLFFSYGHLYVLLRGVPSLSAVARHRVLLPLDIVLMIGAVVYLLRRRLPSWVTPTLNTVAGVAVALALVQSGWIFASTGPPQPVQAASNTELRAPEGSPPRDVYYIILDAYSRADVLQSTFDYDNQPFVSGLEDLGFVVADDSRSNYAMTRLSLPSSLNMDYIDSLGPPIAPGSREPGWLDKIARYGRVRSAFEAMGYKIVAFESAIGMTDWTDADLYMSRNPLALSDAQAFLKITPFETLLIQTSMGRFVIDSRTWINRVFRTDVKSPNEQHRERILFDLERMGEMASVPGPKFVFIHIMSPHQPYVFTADGGVIGESGIFTLADDTTPHGINSPEAYANQVAFLDPRVLAGVKAIVENSPVEPIIIIQGDHGAPGLTGDERMKILNAYYLPDGGDRAIYPTISPVNSFRVVFDKYFGGDLPLLDDRSYFSPTDDPFRLSRVH